MAAQQQQSPVTVDIQVVSDSVCPWCYVGKRRLERAISALPSSAAKFNVSWQPFYLDPTAPTTSINKLERYQKKFGVDRTKQIVAMLTETGKEEGINFSFGGNTGNTAQSHRLIEYAGKHGKQDAVVNALFAAYFEKEQDITKNDVLLGCAANAGLDRAAVEQLLTSSTGTADVDEKVKHNVELGVTGVPFFIINNKYAISGAQTPDVFLKVFQQVGVDVSAKAQNGSNGAAAEACKIGDNGATC